MKSSFLLSLCSASLLAFATSTVAHADALHGFCYGGSTCSDMGSNTPTSVNPPKFGFVSSPSGDTGAFYIDILVPNTGSPAGSLGVLNTTTSTTSSATLFSNTAWTSGQLDTYLALAGGATPANPIGAFLPGTQVLNPTATGFFVYQDSLGTQTLNGSGPLLTLQSALPLGSYIVGFLNIGTANSPNFVGTANSGAIFETGPSSSPVPEPSSLMLLGSGIAVAAGLLRRRMKALA